MGRQIEVKMYCASSKDTYMAIFEEKEPKNWYWVDVKVIPKEPVKKPSLFQKLGFDKILSTTKNEKQNNSGQLKVEGQFYYSTGKCPHCGNGSFVKCGACGELTCFPIGATHFVCGNCGNSGEVSGKISDMKADHMDNGGGKPKVSLSNQTKPRSNGTTLG